MEKRIRLDLMIAVFALLLSAVASIASVYQAHVISQQFSATVWPYLTVSVTSSTSSISLELTNDGLGPALIRSASVTLDGKGVPSFRTLLITLAAAPKITGETRSAVGTFASLSPGDVIRAGDTYRVAAFVGVSGLPSIVAANAERHDATLSICYCSLLGTCWMKVWKPEQDDEPYEVRRCPAPTAIAAS